jgi:phosphohistidine swiveling domain-containing protein
MATNAVETRATFPEDWGADVPDGPPFTFDDMHYPFPISPLFASFRARDGFAIALREYKVPVIAMEAMHRNYYKFQRMVLPEPSDEAEAALLFQPAEEAIRAEMGRLLDRWHGEHLPRIRELLDRVNALDPGLDDLEAALADAEAISTEVWTIHFRIVVPMTLAMQVFDELYADLFGESEGESHALLVGALSESVKSGIGLSDLAQAARDLGLAEVMLESPPANLLANLAAAPGGSDFLGRLDDYLAVYGYRQDLFDYLTSTWIEDPSFALYAIRAYVQSGRDLREEHAAMARSAAAALEDARERLAGYPEPVRGQFEAMLQFARHASFLQEEHNFHIDQQYSARSRLFFLRIGRRLVDAGLIDHPDDVMMLTVNELEELSAGSSSPGVASDLRSPIAMRRHEMEIARTMTPPPFLGKTPPSPPKFSNPMMRGTARFWGMPVEPSEDPRELRGMAGSRGTVSGIARVARTLEEARTLVPGEILVAITTMPPWTPLFAIAAAVVTESGGPLSHCAIVAREYGIPAAVGVPGATQRIKTGQRITVDGATGSVRLDA